MKFLEKFIKRFPVHKLWKEAIVVFPQGVNSKSPWDIKAEKTGWQFQIGDYNDRDIKFFDTMYTYFSNTFPIDDERVYCTGSSNGGTFTYILLFLLNFSSKIKSPINVETLLSITSP